MSKKTVHLLQLKMGGIVAKDSRRPDLRSWSSDSADQNSNSARRLTHNVVRENRVQDIHDYYEIDSESVLGLGLNGEVVVCTHKATQLNYALKTLSKTEVTEEVLTFFRNELSCMACLDHPNILRVHEVFETDDTVYLVMDLCTGGHLKDRLLAQTGSYYTEKLASKYIYIILQAIAYCHANNVVHRDLKLENILFETEDRDAELKIIGIPN